MEICNLMCRVTAFMARITLLIHHLSDTSQWQAEVSNVVSDIYDMFNDGTQSCYA